MSDNRQEKRFIDNICKIGTPECAIFSAVIAMMLALLYLSIGFWNTVLVAILMGVGAFLGGVKDKKQWIKNLLNRVVPDHKTVPYREQNPEILKAVREATGKAAEAEEAAFQASDESEQDE